MRLNSFNAYATHFDNFEAIGEVLDVCKLKLYFSAPYTIDGKIKIDNLGNLRALDLDNIQHYATLPTAKMKVLERIKLYSCNIHNLQAVQPSIKYFEAYFCKNINKQSIETISTWANLTELHLKYISEDVNILPESLSQLKLRVLDLNHIPLKVIPDFIGQIHTLNVLYLDGFYVDGLPKSIASLPNLSYLSIESTTFRHKLAEDFRQLKIKQLKIYMSKFAGNNMKQDLYEPLITPNMTKIVREFKFE